MKLGNIGLAIVLVFSSAAWADSASRIDQLMSQMTLEEKVSLVHADSKFTAAGIPRLGIPPLTMSDGPHGVREEISHDDWNAAGNTDDFSTWLPVNLCLAATFDPHIANSYGAVIGQEARHRGKDVMLGPSLNIQRTPLCGRNFEYMGEDPFLTGRMAVGYIRGEQAQGISSCAKHFAANNQEINRGTIDVEMDERTLREIYLPAFRAAVQEGGVHCIMGAYNEFRGQHCCHNDYLLNKILKGEWGFQGLVMTDWGGAHDTMQSAMNGLDLEMGTDGPYDQYYLADPFLQLLKRGEIPVSVLDDKVRRRLRVMEAIGALDRRDNSGSINTKEHQDTAREVAEEGIVLLKNDHDLLPLDAGKVGTIAVIGENAVREMGHAGGSAEIKAFYEVTPLQGIIKRAGPQANVTFSMGYARPEEPNQNQPAAGRNARPTSRPRATAEQLVASAVRAASQADVAIVVAGLPHIRLYDSEGSDRKNLRLPYGQDALIEKVAAANPHTIVVLVDGGAVEMPWVDHVQSIMQAWYPGMEGGNALAEILFGDVNPSGKLPCTFPKQLSDTPTEAMGTYPGKNGIEHYDEGLLVGYRWYDAKSIEPLFPFGFGLSYTKFDYGNLRLDDTLGTHGPQLTVECNVTAAVGSRSGTEVVQVYVSPVHSSVARPPKELKGFARVYVRPGEIGQAFIPLGFSAFAYYDPNRSAWVAEKGEYTIQVGSSSRDIRLSGTYTINQTTVEKN